MIRNGSEDMSEVSPLFDASELLAQARPIVRPLHLLRSESVLPSMYLLAETAQKFFIVIAFNASAITSSFNLWDVPHQPDS